MEGLDAVIGRVRSVLRRIPLVGPLADCRWPDPGETFKQVAITVVFGTAPFWLGALLFKGLSDDQTLTLTNILDRTG